MPLARSTQLIIHDPRGCGRSIATQQVYTINQMANDVVALLDHLGIKNAHFVGHSMGGRIALELALNFPGRVKSLIMAASGSGQAVRPGPDCIPGLPHWLVIRLVEKGFEKALREEYCDTSAFFTDDYRKQHPDKVARFSARLAYSCEACGIYPLDHRSAQLGGDPPTRRCAMPHAGSHWRQRFRPQQPPCPGRSTDKAHHRRRIKSAQRAIPRLFLASSGRNQ